MTSHPIRTQPELDADPRAADAQYYRRILHRLIDRADELAERVHQQAKAAEAPAADAAIPLDRIARTIRRCIMLALKVSEPATTARTAMAEERRVAARKLVIRHMEDSIHREAGRYEADALSAELLERLDAPEFEHDLDRPLMEIVGELRADLGLGADNHHQRKRRTPRDIALLQARAAAPAGQLRREPPRCRGRP